MVNGSDYPVPAVNISRPTKVSSFIYKNNHITSDDKKALDMIYRYNPLLFDFVVKRTIKYKDKDTGNLKRIPESMFMPIK